MRSLLRIQSCGFGAAIAILLAVASIEAQDSGGRSLGQPLSAGSSTLFGGRGTIIGSERFLRKNRSARDFVGADRDDASKFVGNIEANAGSGTNSSGPSVPVATDRSAEINKSLPTSTRNTIYEPVLVVEFEFPQISPTRVERDLSLRLSKMIPQLAAHSVVVSMEGRKAIVQGEVASESSKKLVETLIRFEPGVSSVDNRLQVVPQLEIIDSSSR
jgi:hypothetical protein